MPITREQEKELRDQLKKITKDLIKQFKLINKCIEDKKLSGLSSVITGHKNIVSKAKKSFELSVESYSFAPLGKDLRRNISYSMISVILRDISDNSKNLTQYLLVTHDYKISNKWVNSLSLKIIDRLQEVDTLLSSESKTKAILLIERDETVNKLYKKEMKTVSEKIKSAKVKISTKDETIITQGFILAVKSFELIADGIKKIAEMSLYISTGELF